MSTNHVTLFSRSVVNDQHVDIHITPKGSDLYWAITSIMGCTMLAILMLGLRKPKNSRIFFYILSATTFVAMIEYYSMASKLGWAHIDVQRQRSSDFISGANRQVWWVRYCGW